jgi:protein SCO1/2
MPTRQRWLTTALALTLAVLVAAVLAILLFAGHKPQPATVSAGGSNVASAGPFLTGGDMPAALAARTVRAFDLRDARGGRFSSASLHGRPYAVTFLYVHCVDVCPLIGSEIHEAMAKLGPRSRAMTVVAISVDPRGDTPKAVRRWLAEHQEPPQFHYLIGSKRTLAPIWKSFYVQPQTPGDPHSTHTAIIWLVNRNGHPAALIPAGAPLNPSNLAHDFGVLESQ